MQDTFNLGEPAKHPRGATGQPNVATIAIGVLALAVVLAAATGVLLLAREGGETVAAAQATAVAQVDRAADAVAELSLQRAATVAQALVAEATATDGLDGGTLAAATPEALTAYEPSLRFTAEPSTGPEIVSVAAAPDLWSAAVWSSSGTCLWVRIDLAGATTRGSGAPCTGAAAAAADQGA